MNPLSRPLTRPRVLISGQPSRLIVGSIMICVALLGATAVTSAQSNAPDQGSSSSAPAASVKVQSSPSAQAPQATSAPQSTQVASKAQSDKDEFERVKEARLDELRYKHLWIAYSLVWLIVFIFIRGTWRRSQAVEQRIVELQERLSKLE